MNDPTPGASPPGMATVYRATLDALAQYGPRRTGVTHIARLAGTNRPYLYRNWSSPRALLQDATLAELHRLLHVAGDLTDRLPPGCLEVHRVVRAARLLREHPVVRTLARTAPELAHAAVLRPTTVWHRAAWAWLRDDVAGRLPRDTRDTTVRALLTTALPYALTPPPDAPDPDTTKPDTTKPGTTHPDTTRPDTPDPGAARAAVDRRLSQALHPCLGLPADCPHCHPHRGDAANAGSTGNDTGAANHGGAGDDEQRGEDAP